MPVSVSFTFMDVSQGCVLACANKNGDTVGYAERRQDRGEIRQKAYNCRGLRVPHRIRPSHRVSQIYLASLTHPTHPCIPYAEAALGARLRELRWKNSAWLATADTIAGWNGFEIRNAGSGRSPVRKRSG